MAKVAFSGKRELRWLQEGDCIISYLQPDTEFSDALWNEWLAAITGESVNKAMICSWGDIQPSKEQWRTATRLLRGSKKKFVVVSESRHTSALAKAASWAGADIQAFRWEHVYDASVHIGLEREQRVSIRATLTALRDYFGAVNTDGELASTVGGPAFTSNSFAPTRAPAPEFASPRPPASSPAWTRPAVTDDAAQPSRTPMADAASRNLEHVRQTSEEIQNKLAEIQARLRESRRLRAKS